MQENLGRFKSHGNKPFLVNLQCVEYEFKRSLCGANYIGYTNRHLHLDIEEHKFSVIAKHLKNEKIKDRKIFTRDLPS